MRRPLNEPVRVTGDRASHAEYGVGPATDYGCGIGTPVYAPFSGRLSRYTTTEGGLGVIVWGADAAFYGQHLSAQGTPGDYDEGDEIALSGNSGRNILDPSVPYDPHLHCYVIIHATGERLAMEEYLAQAGEVAGQTTPRTEEDDMSMNTIRHPNGTIFFADDLGADHLGDYKTDDIGLGEFLEANARVFGPADQLTAREFDIATAIASRRWARKKAEIVQGVVDALKATR